MAAQDTAGSGQGASPATTAAAILVSGATGAAAAELPSVPEKVAQHEEEIHARVGLLDETRGAATTEEGIANAGLAAVKRIAAAWQQTAETRTADLASSLHDSLSARFPAAPPELIGQLVRDEMRHEATFNRRQRARLEDRLARAFREKDPTARQQAVTRTVDREKQVLSMREEAMLERCVAGIDRHAVKQASPEGGYWALDPTVMNHTAGCLAMGEKFWPWEVLDRYHPPLHNGCPCQIISMDEAIQRGLMTETDVPRTDDAIRRAQRAVALERKLHEAASAEEVELFVAECLDDALAIQERRYGLEEARRHPAGYERETAEIKKRASTAEAKARHSFRPARWTHPNGHPRCSLCGQEEPIGGVCNGKPTREEAQAWADRQNREDVKLGMKPSWYVNEKGALQCAIDGLPDAALAEAPRRYDLRYPKGTVKGGEFMPRVGGVAGETRKALKRLLPDVGLSPVEGRREKRGRYVWLRGHYTFVPRDGSFDRTIDGVRFESPVGSTDVYRNGYLVDVEGQRFPHHADLDKPKQPDIRLIPGTAEWDKAQADKAQADRAAADTAQADPGAERDAEIAAVADRIRRTPPAADRPPVTVGAPAAITHDALLAAGWRVTSTKRAEDTRDLAVGYVDPERGSSIAIYYDTTRDRVLGVTAWRPRTSPPVQGRELTAPPRSWDEFAQDVQAYARSVAKQRGTIALVGGVESDPSRRDHAGAHEWDGTILLGEDVKPTIERLAAEGENALSEQELRSLYAAYKVATHEALHAANAASREEYARPSGKALEEALTEDLAHVYTIDRLHREGLDRTAQWALDNPLDDNRLGSYWGYRNQLQRLLDEARVPVEDRLAVEEGLKFMPDVVRYEALAGMLRKGADDNVPTGIRTRIREDAEQYARDVMSTGASPLANAGFWPGLAPRFGSAKVEHFDVGGTEIVQGSVVGVSRHRFGQPPAIDEATVLGLQRSGIGGVDYLATVQYADGTIDRITNTTIATVSAESASPHIELADGETATVGDTISYGGAADGRRRIAQITRILSTGRPGALDWAVEARTTNGTPIVLTWVRGGRSVAREETAPAPALPIGVVPPPEPGPDPSANITSGPETADLPAWAAFMVDLYEHPPVDQPFATIPAIVMPVAVGSLDEEGRTTGTPVHTLTLPSGRRVRVTVSKPESGDGVPKVAVAELPPVTPQDPGTLKRPIESELLDTLREYQRAMVAAASGGASDLGQPDPGAERPTTKIRIPPVLLTELIALESDTAAGDNPPHDALADALNAAWQARKKDGSAEVEFTPETARYLARSLGYHQSIWQDRAEFGNSEDKRVSSAARRGAKTLQPKLLAFAGSHPPPMDPGATSIGYDPPPRMERSIAEYGAGKQPWEMTPEEFRDFKDKLLLFEGRSEFDRIARALHGFEDLPSAMHQYGQDFRFENPGIVRRYQNVKPGDQVTLYRAVGLDDPNPIRPGDWVALDKSYADMHGANGYDEVGGSKILKLTVPAKDVTWAGTSADEWIYSPAGLRDPDEKQSVHEHLVRWALRNGKRVPLNVLSSYPHLEPLQEAFNETLHPRGRGGKFRRTVHVPKPEKPTRATGELHRIEEFLDPPEAGELGRITAEAAAAIDGLIRVPTLPVKLPIVETRERNRRGVYIQEAPPDWPEPPKYKGPLTSLYTNGEPDTPAKRAADVQIGDRLLLDRGRPLKVVDVGRPTEDGSLGDGRDYHGGDVIIDVTDGKNVYTQPFSPDDLLPFDWRPPKDQMPPPPPMDPKAIEVSTSVESNDESPVASLVHEIGHYLDNRAFEESPLGWGTASEHAAWRNTQTPGQRADALAEAREIDADQVRLWEFYDSDAPSLLDEWWKAIERTPEVQALHAPEFPGDEERHQYLLSPTELFARSFAQWVGTRSQNPHMIRWLRAWQAKKSAGDEEPSLEQVLFGPPVFDANRQWQDDTFEPVGRALDDLFGKLGWLR